VGTDNLTFSNIIFEDNNLHDGYHSSGVGIVNDDSETGNSFNNIIIRRNFIWDNPARHAVADGFDANEMCTVKAYSSGCTTNNIQIYDNIWAGSSQSCIWLDHASNVSVYNNTFYSQNTLLTSAEAGGIDAHLYISDGCIGVVVKNNIFYGLCSYAANYSACEIIVTDGGRGQSLSEIFCDYNLFYQADDNLDIIHAGSNYKRASWATMKSTLGWQTHDPGLVNPQFISEPNDLHLSTSSPAIGAGIAIPGITTDYEGKAFINPPNIGCYATLVISNNPVYVSSVIENAAPSLLSITYNLSLANIVPAASAFTVRVNTVARTVTGVSISGTKVQLTLSSPVVYGDVVTVAYTKPAGNPLQTPAGGQAATISAQAVTNNVNSVNPVYTSSVVQNATPTLLSITYNLSLANIVPAASAFTVRVNTVARTVTGVSISGTKVQLTLSSPAVNGDVVTVAYNKPATNPLQTASGGQAVTISAQSVTNNIGHSNDPPVIVLNYLTSCNSGFIGEIDASGTYDLNNDNLIFEWSSPDNVPISSVTDPDIQFLAPVVSARDTIEFIVKVTDGIAIQSKTIQIVILPYKPGLDEAKIVNIAAVNYSAPDYPNNIADGKTETQWSSKGDDQWIISGLFSPFKISYLLLSFPNDQTGDVFDIYASKDSLTWDPVLINAASCSFSGNLQVFDFPASFAGNEYSFVKIIGHGNATDTWNHISELKIYGYSQEKQLSSSKTNIILFPNPAQTFFNISFEEPLLKPVSVKIIDESGKLMYDNIIAAGINNLQIPVNFKTGFYIVEMYSEGIIIGVKKLLIHK
jgi:uncharacterized repeat protein (TIGR02059 family)